MFDVTEKLQIVGQNPDGTFNVRVQQTGGELVPAESGGGAYPVRINGTVVNFASAADYQRARAALLPGDGGGMPEFNTRGNSGGGAGFLRTATDAAETVGGALDARNFAERRREFQDIEAAVLDARQKLAAQSGTNPALVPPILELFDSFADAIALAIQNTEEDIRSALLRTGVGAGRTISDFSSSQRGGSESSLLGAGVAVGGAVLLANALGSRRRRR